MNVLPRFLKDKTKIGSMGPGSKEGYAHVYTSRGDCPESFKNYKYDNKLSSLLNNVIIYFICRGVINWGDGKETRVSFEYREQAAQYYRTHKYDNPGCYYIEVRFGQMSPFCGQVMFHNIKV